VGGWCWGTTTEGPAVSRARAAVLFTTVIFLLSAAVAHAQPSLELTESAARAGDLVHFSISGADGSITYALEVDDKQVLEGTGGAVSDTFTVPDLGDVVRTVTVEAEIRGSDKRKKLKRKLLYLGSALPALGPPAPAPTAAVPAVVPAAPPSTQPIYSPNAIEGPSPAPAVTPRSRRRPRQSRKRRAVGPPRHVARSEERRRHAHRGHGRRNRDAETRNTRSKRPAPWAAPLFETVPEPGARARPGGGIFSLNAIAPRTAVLAATTARSGDGGGRAAVVVPALLGLAGLALAGTAVLRRRRLASRPKRD
jgi:hypothetical protein